MYNTRSTEQAIQVVGGVMPGENTVRLGENIPMSWDYEFRMEDARKVLGLSSEEKMTLLLAREYVYSLLKAEDLPEPVKIWRETQETIKKEMDEFNSFMAEIASDVVLNQPTLVSKAKKYFPLFNITNKMKIKDIVNLILYGIEPPITNEEIKDTINLMHDAVKSPKPKTKSKKKSKK